MDLQIEDARNDMAKRIDQVSNSLASGVDAVVVVTLVDSPASPALSQAAGAAGVPLVFANNDEMAIGAIQAMKASGVGMDDVIVAGVDATADALQAMGAGELDVTVFQNATAQRAGGLDAALALARGEAVESPVYVPFALVTPETMADHVGMN